ncbi:MAG TPA: hypothetical protein DCX60_05885 [Phycisphaerales bacterium]|nr:hypothetical protein [Phycisphaerales bacterium]
MPIFRRIMALFIVPMPRAMICLILLFGSDALASAVLPPENNGCSDAIPVFSGNTQFSNIQANTDGPLSSACSTLGSGVIHNDIWFEFIATQTGTLSLSTCNQADFDTRIAVYVGSCEMLTEVGCNDDGFECSGYTSELLTPCVEDERYLIRLGSFHPSQSGQGVITIEISPPCFFGCEENTRSELEACGSFANDGCGAGYLGGVDGGQLLHDVPHGSETIGLNETICGSWHFDGSVRDTDWYRLVVPEPGATLDIVVESSEFMEANLFIAAESCPLEILEYVTGGCRTDISLDWVTAGAYQIIVAPGFERIIQCGDPNLMDRYSLSVMGEVSTENAPLNDLCADAILISDGLHDFSTFYASTDGPPDSPLACGDFGTAIGADIWFEYVSDVTGTVTVSLCDLANFDTRLEIRADGCDGPMVACNDDAEGCGEYTSAVSFAAQCGERYSLRIGGYDKSRGEGQLEISSVGDCCLGDFDGDGIVGGSDLAAFLAVWGSSESEMDFDGDGVVGGTDLATILAAWGEC